MHPNNYAEIKSIRTKFAVLYIASLILMLIISAAIFSGGNKKVVTEKLADSGQSQSVPVDKLLHHSLLQIQLLDEQHMQVLSDTILMRNLKLMNEKLDGLNEQTELAENTFRKSMDSLELHRKEWGNKSELDSLIQSFNLAFDNHKSLNNIFAVAIVKNLGKNSDNEAFIKWQGELQKKDGKIRLLEEQLKNVFSKSPANSTAQVNFYKTENEDLKTSFKEQETKNAYMTNVNNALRQDNDRLLTEMEKIKKNNLADDAGKQTKNTEAERQIQDLKAQLYLAQVDCNLTRADAGKIVSNSRQRKDLLAEAMAVLNNLSQYDNASVQRKVKEKTAQLKTIANTVRD